MNDMQPYGCLSYRESQRAFLSTGLGKTELFLASGNNTEVHRLSKASQVTKEPGLLPKTILPTLAPAVSVWLGTEEKVSFHRLPCSSSAWA